MNKKLIAKCQTLEQCFTIKPVYSGRLEIAGIFSWNRPNYSQTLIEKTADIVIANNCYSGHNFLTPCEKFKPNLRFYSVHLIFFVGK